MTATLQSTHFGFLLLPDFPMACLTSAIEPLRAANEIGEKTIFHWKLLSEDGNAVRSSAGVVFQPDTGLEQAEDIDVLIVLAGPKSAPTNPGRTYGRLRYLARHGTPLGAVSGGVFPLARSGVLEGHLCSVHWCYRAAFENEFPDLLASDDVVVLGPSRLTASGAAAAFDMMLSVIEHVTGPEIATEVACWFQHPVMRSEGVRQRTPSLMSDETTDALPILVKQAIELFAQNVEFPLSTQEVAKALNVSPRQLERNFRDALDESPARYYRIIRLRAARQLVRFTNQPISEIAESVGYGTTTRFSHLYKDMFGLRPTEDRSRANSFRVEENLTLPSTTPSLDGV